MTNRTLRHITILSLSVFAVMVLSTSIMLSYAQPAIAQTHLNDHIVINEVDTNPPGSDAASVSEWVELYNPTQSTIDLSGWTISSTTLHVKTMTIPQGTTIMPGQFLTYSYDLLWFSNTGEYVLLSNADGDAVDKTPPLYDSKDDSDSWQRIYDGYGNSGIQDWKFTTPTTGSSNGKLVEYVKPDGVTIDISSDKQSYSFGQSAQIDGSVSERLTIIKPTFRQEPVMMTISGPDFSRTLTLYPDNSLSYGTVINLDALLGINAGAYNVTAKYADSIARTTFSVGMDDDNNNNNNNNGLPTLSGDDTDAPPLQIITDKQEYLPGDPVSITGSITDEIFLEGVRFNVTDPNGHVIARGNLFPTSGMFSTEVLMTSINPVFGTYLISATYSKLPASTSFELIKDVKEDVHISLDTDRTAYGLGDLVTINGRLNQVWVNTLDLEITQTRQIAISSGTSPHGSGSGFKIQDGVSVMGDGSFTYSFTIPDNDARLGDYRIHVSQDLGSVSVVVHVVEDPDSFVPPEQSLTIQLDQQSYDLGQSVTIMGFIRDSLDDSTYKLGRDTVKITISRDDDDDNGSGRLGTIVQTLTTTPETSGRYTVSASLINALFYAGDYTVIAEHLRDSAAVSFQVVNPLVGTGEVATITLDKQVYGLGETITLTGILPPTGTSAVDITLIRPDGTTINSGAIVDNQRFSWSWDVPTLEKSETIKSYDARTYIPSNFGVYKITVYADERRQDLLFKVSADPENDSLPDSPIFVTTEKSLYRAGEKLHVMGNVLRISDGGLVAPPRVTVKVLDGSFPYKQIHESAVYPNQGGGFSSIFELPTTVFPEGPYTVRALYNNIRAETTFGVANDLVLGSKDPLTLLLYLDKSEYNPGDMVLLNGKPNRLIYLEEFDVSVAKKDATDITCGAFHCGPHTGTITSIRAGPTGSFEYQFAVPDSADSVGSYEITVDADFEVKTITFDVVQKIQNDTAPVVPDTPTDAVPTLMPGPVSVIEKENRIPRDYITIPAALKQVPNMNNDDNDNLDSMTVAPRIVLGSVITTKEANSDVNLMVTHVPTGICVIGPATDCMVSNSTQKPGNIYEIVEIDGFNINVRYTGPDVRLEKFTILPESSMAFLPDSDWDVRILKESEDQISRFYYTVIYRTTV